MVYTLYLSSLIISAVVAIAEAWYFWQRRHAPGGAAITFAMLAIAVWSLGYVLQLSSAELSQQVMATCIQYIGIVILPVAWFAFSLQYTGRGSWLTGSNLFLLLIIPSITLILAWSSNFHDLMWSGRHLETSGPFVVIVKTYGPWFWVHTVYSYFLILAGTLALIQRLFRSPRLYRSQSIALLAAVATPLVWNVLYIFRLLPAYRIDLTPSAFAMSGLLIGWGLFRFRLFDIIPIARDSVIENMSEGVIVLDVQNRLIDINPAGQRIIGYPLSAVIGQPFASVLASYPEIVERSYVSAKTIEAYAEVAIEKEGTRHHYELHASPLRDRRGRIIGRLIMLRDITERQEKEKQD